MAVALLSMPGRAILAMSAILFALFASISALPASKKGCGCFGKRSEEHHRYLSVSWRMVAAIAAMMTTYLPSSDVLPLLPTLFGVTGLIGLALSLRPANSWTRISTPTTKEFSWEMDQSAGWVKTLERRRFLGAALSGTLLALLPFGKLAPAWACVGPPVGDLPPPPDNLSCGQRHTACKTCCTTSAYDCSYSSNPADCVEKKIDCEADCETCHVKCQTTGSTDCRANFGTQDCWVG